VGSCQFCAKDVPENAKRCPHCLREASEGDVYELSVEANEIPSEWQRQRGAVYTLEFPARCPYCRELIRTLQVMRLKRTAASFTSPLPRAGRVVTCPECERILTAELTAL
jgi:hypothetical protein